MNVWPSEPRAADARADLAAHVASRLCHDLISPIGAIGNGVELLGMSGIAGPEMDLISQSVEGASARVRFFRVAFGTAEPGQTVESVHLAEILANPHRGGKLRVAWGPTGPVARPEAKLMFLLVMCAEAALVAGGEARVSQRGADWRIEAGGRAMRADPLTWSALTGGAGAPYASGTIQFPLAASHAAAIGMALSVDIAPDRVAVLARPAT